MPVITDCSKLHRIALVLLTLMLVACQRRAKTGEGPRPLSPQAAVQNFRLSEDFRIELFLSEPQVLSPVEMVFDETGRIYVAEMLDYPDDPPPGRPARSRIRLLEDADGDGRYEKATVLADQVLQVSGLLPWREGLLVTSAPDILWMKDNDGTGYPAADWTDVRGARPDARRVRTLCRQVSLSAFARRQHQSVVGPGDASLRSNYARPWTARFRGDEIV
jgi:hypothetical protein